MANSHHNLLFVCSVLVEEVAQHAACTAILNNVFKIGQGADLVPDSGVYIHRTICCAEQIPQLEILSTI